MSVEGAEQERVTTPQPHFVLVWEDASAEDEKVKQHMRSSFISNLKNEGVEIEAIQVRTEGLPNRTYLNLKASQRTQKIYAEKLNMMVALTESEQTTPETKEQNAKFQEFVKKNWSESFLEFLKPRCAKKQIPNIMQTNVEELYPLEPFHYMSVFKNSKVDKYLYKDEPDKLFTTVQKQRIMWEILQTTPYEILVSEEPENNAETRISMDEKTVLPPIKSGASKRNDPSPPPDAANYSTAQEERKDTEEASAGKLALDTDLNVGIDNLLNENVFDAAYPPHEGVFETKTYKRMADVEKDLNNRQVLFEYWAKWKRWYKYQPLEHIRMYFGEKVAFYFAWIGFYTSWLVPVSIVGLIVFIFGLATTMTRANRKGEEICSSEDKFRMCPLCDERKISEKVCIYWKLSDICMNSRVAYVFDNGATVFFAIFVALWAVVYLEFWKRKSAQLAYKWNTMDFKEVERPRQKYKIRVKRYWDSKLKKHLSIPLDKIKILNIITGEEEPNFPGDVRIARILSAYALLLIMVAAVIIFLMGTIAYRVSIQIVLSKSDFLAGFGPRTQTIANATGAVLNLICIIALGFLYKKLAYLMNTWEMHRTQTQFDDQLSIKMFLFQFTNLYSSVLYIAFFKGKFVGIPGEDKGIASWKESCSMGGCLFELAIQMAIIMVGKQIFNNVMELGLPFLKKLWKKFRNRKRIKDEDELNYYQLDPLSHSDSSDVTKSQSDSRLKGCVWDDDKYEEKEGLLYEYLEIVIQFGFITFFVAAFPLAPVFALLNNWVEIRLDAQKYVTDSRRPVGMRAQDIGVWMSILNVLTQMAVISNAFLIALTSDFLPQLVYYYTTEKRDGFVEFSLAAAPNGTTSKPCHYEAFRDNNGEFTMFYWRLTAARLVFVVIFEHFVFFIARLIDVLIPDVPEQLKTRIMRERFLAKIALTDAPAD